MKNTTNKATAAVNFALISERALADINAVSVTVSALALAEIDKDAARAALKRAMNTAAAVKITYDVATAAAAADTSDKDKKAAAAAAEKDYNDAAAAVTAAENAVKDADKEEKAATERLKLAVQKVQQYGSRNIGGGIYDRGDGETVFDVVSMLYGFGVVVGEGELNRKSVQKYVEPLTRYFDRAIHVVRRGKAVDDIRKFKTLYKEVGVGMRDILLDIGDTPENKLFSFDPVTAHIAFTEKALAIRG